jgi:hypothetical protein
VGSPKGREPYGDAVPVVVAGVTTCQGVRESRKQGEGEQVTGHHKTWRYAKCRSPKRYWVSSVSITHGIVTGEPVAVKVARRVRRGAMGKRAYIVRYLAPWPTLPLVTSLAA